MIQRSISHASHRTSDGFSSQIEQRGIDEGGVDDAGEGDGAGDGDDDGDDEGEGDGDGFTGDCAGVDAAIVDDGGGGDAVDEFIG